MNSITKLLEDMKLEIELGIFNYLRPIASRGSRLLDIMPFRTTVSIHIHNKLPMVCKLLTSSLGQALWDRFSVCFGWVGWYEESLGHLSTF